MSYTRNSSADLVWNSTSNSYVPYSSSRNYVHQIKTVSLQNDCYANINYLNTVNLHDIVFVNNSAVNAFYNCQNLHSVYNISNTVTDISHAFASDNNLLVTPTVPDSVVNMYRAFYGCSNIVTPPVIPNSVTDITWCFEGASRMSAIPTVPDSVVQCVAAFKDCANTTNTYGNYINNVTGVDFTFYNTGLDTINMSFPKAYSCGYTFGYCNNLRIATIDAPNCTNAINMFAHCPNLATVSITAPNLSNAYGMFMNCTNLAGQLYFNSTNITNAVDCFANTSLKKEVIIKYIDDNDQPTATYNSFNSAYPVNTVNCTTVGTLTENNGVVSGFSDANHLELNETLNVGDNNWEMVFKIKTPTIGTAQDWGGHSSLADQLGMSLYLSADGYASYNIGDTAWLIQPRFASNLLSNTWYWFKAKYENDTYYAYYSTDGITYTLTQSVTHSYKLQPVNMWLGDYVTGGTAWFQGEIDLKECYIKIDGLTWWRGYVRPNGVVLKDIDGSMLSIAPTPQDSTVLMFNEATGATVNLDQFNYTYSNANVEIQSLNTTDTVIVVPSIYTETSHMRAVDGSSIRYDVSKDGYYGVDGKAIVDGSQEIPVNLEQVMCKFEVAPMPMDATVTFDIPLTRQIYGWDTNDDASIRYTLTPTVKVGDPVYKWYSYPKAFFQAYTVTSVESDTSFHDNETTRYNRKVNEDMLGPAYDYYSYDYYDIHYVTVPWGTEIPYTVSKAHHITVTSTEIVKTTGSKFVPLMIDQHTFTVNTIPNDATIQILVNGRLANASSTDWTFTSNNLNGDIELQAYTGSNTVVTMPTQYNCENTVTADYGSTIEYKISKEGHKDVTGTLTLEQDTTITVNMGDAVDVGDYNYTLTDGVLTLTQYLGEGGDIETPLIEEI